MGRKSKIAYMIFFAVWQAVSLYQGSRLVAAWNPWLRAAYVVNGFLIFILDAAWLVKRANELKKRQLREQLFEYELKKGIEERRREQKEELKRSYDQLRTALRSELREVRETYASGRMHEQKETIREIFGKERQPWDRRRCANAVGDAVLREKERRCKEKAISLHLDTWIPQTLRLSDYHLCSLLSNLADNAMEACMELEEKERWIRIQARTEGNYLYLMVENSCTQSHVRRPKRPGRGLGLEIVRGIAEEYGGTLQTETGEDWYRTKVLVQV